MQTTRKQQIAWWADKVRSQAMEYAEIADPNRKRQNQTANKLDAIASLCQRIHFELTGHLIRSEQ